MLWRRKDTLRIVAISGLASVLMPGLALGETVAAQMYHKHVETHPSQGDIRTIDGAEAVLMTTEEGAFINIETRELKPSHAYTLWFVAINDPSACETSPCKAPDVVKRSAMTVADVGYVDSVVATADGTGVFSAFQPVGDLQAAWFGNGYQDAMGAEIHLVIRDHGPLLTDRAAAMLHTFRDGCTDDSVLPFLPDTAKGHGDPGPNTCADVQDVIFMQTAPETAQTR